MDHIHSIVVAIFLYTYYISCLDVTDIIQLFVKAIRYALPCSHAIDKTSKRGSIIQFLALTLNGKRQFLYVID